MLDGFTTRPRRAQLSGLALVLAASLSTAAEPGDGDTPLASPLVETATVRAAPLATATAAVTVIDREAIEALEVTTVGELLRYAAGVDLVGSGSRAGSAWAQVRGGDANMTAVMIDGVPLNDMTDQIGGGIVDLNSLSLHHVERVEIARGPLSFFYGSSGLAGAINVITRQVDIGSEAGSTVDFEAGAGTSSLVTGALALRSRVDAGRIYVGVSWDEEQERVADDRFEQLALSTSMQFGRPGATELRVSGRLASRETDDYPDASGGPLFGDGALRRSDHTEAVIGIDLLTDGADGRRRHALRFNWLHHTLDRSSPAIGFSVPPSVERTEFSNVEAGWNLPLVDGPRHRLACGADLQHETGDNRSVLSLPPTFGGDVDGSYDLERTTGGAYVEYRRSAATVDLDLGLRVDVPDEGDTQVSPRLGLALHATDAPVRLRASFARGFKLPGFFALASPPQLGGNPDLEPERSSGFDVSIEWAPPGGRTRGSVGVFKVRYEDLIDFDFQSFSFVNRSRVVSRGIESLIHWRIATDWTVEASLTRQEVEGPDEDSRLRHRPDFHGAARVSWQALERLRWTADLQSVSSRFDRQLTVPTRESVAGYGVVGTAISVDVGRGWTIWTRVDNLLDREYETFIGFPGAGRSLRAGLRRRAG